jgi:hypothetical protein
MTRSINAATQAASGASTIRPVLFVKLAFDSADINRHSELGDITWGDDTYIGVGALGSVGAVTEDSVLGRTPLTIGLSGLPTSLVSLLFNERYQGRKATVYLGYRDTTTMQLVADPVILHRGLMDSPTIQQDSQLAIALNIENRFAQWDTPLIRRYNNADQQALFPGDKGMEFIAQTADLQIAWGTQLVTP